MALSNASFTKGKFIKALKKSLINVAVKMNESLSFSKGGDLKLCVNIKPSA